MNEKQQEDNTVQCVHPELITLPVGLDRLWSVMCSACLMTLSLSYGHFVQDGPCIASLVGETFGSVWEAAAAMWCQCKTHRRQEQNR